MTIRIEMGDMNEVVPRLITDGIVVDAIVTDPPYHLTMVNRFGARNAKSAQTAVHRRFAKGFMGQGWDGGDVAFRPETWKNCLSILRPGGFLLAFGGTRTFHRVACAIEDAGFVMQDTILNMLSTDDRVMNFLDSLSIGQRQAFAACVTQAEPTGLLAWVFGTGFPKRKDMLKPGFEPIVVAYRPDGPRTLQVDECRISFVNSHDEATKNYNPPGRYPANVVHDGSPEVLDAFAAFGTVGCGGLGGFNKRGGKRQSKYGFRGTMQQVGFDDVGTAARFFYSAKADAGDRWHSKHPTVKPVDLMRWLVKLVCPPDGTVLDPFAGSGTTGAAALIEGRNVILIEREAEYLDDIRRRLRYEPLAEAKEPNLGLLGLPL